MQNLEFLEERADLLSERYAGWEQRTIERIAKKVNKIGKMNLADVKALNNAAMAKEEMEIIIKDLAATTGKSIGEINDIYGKAIATQHGDNKYLYDYRHKDFVPFKDNRQLQAIARAYSKNTAETMINLTNTKALGFIGKDGKFVKMQDTIFDTFGKATMEIATGTSDFTTAMRGVIEQLGGSGVTVHYGSGVNRRLDTVVRQNLLWGAKQASNEYNDMIGEELDCDGIEIDYHSNPRPSHRFMQGEMFSLKGKKTINGVTYEDAKEALERLEDYGCLHYRTPVILGVSEPRYDKGQLEQLRANDLKTHTVDGITKSGYEWTQDMRKLETAARKEKDKINALKALGNSEDAIKKHRKKLKAINEKYNKICDETGLTPQKNRMRVYGKGSSVEAHRKISVVDKNKNGGIISIGRSVGAMAKNYDVRLPDGTISKLTEGTDIVDIEVFAGKGTNTNLRVKNKLVENYGGTADNWQHTKGRGFVDTPDGSKKAMLHWFEEETVGIVEMFVKEWSKK